jgi:peptidoglycan hydrolase CwlO-like protein
MNIYNELNMAKNEIHDLVIDVETFYETKDQLQKQVKDLDLKIKRTNTKIYNVVHGIKKIEF